MMDDGYAEGTASFPIFDESDLFTTAFHVSGLHYNKLNDFTNPNMRVLNSGYIKDIFITIHGNETSAKGHVIMSYEDYKITLMNKKGIKKKKLLSAVANAIIKKENDTEKQEEFTVDRNKERSFFNYLWLCIQKAMITVMT